MDRRASGISASCTQHRHQFDVALSKEILEQVSKELESNVLEGEGGSMKELKNRKFVIERDDRCNVRTAKGRIAAVDDVLQVRFRDFGLRHIQLHHFVRKLLEVQSPSTNWHITKLFFFWSFKERTKKPSLHPFHVSSLSKETSAECVQVELKKRTAIAPRSRSEIQGWMSGP
mmetsp:Transcript_35872/g.69313  ORF Transcript_35872/g.69313 Transcript_35872/m.69313 type:complete len:173 (+) Transcript_35872:1269-1787(+)